VLGEPTHLVAVLLHVFGGDLELVAENPPDFVQDVVGNGQFDLTGAGKFEELERFAAPEEGGDVTDSNLP